MRSTYDRRGGNEGADASHFLYQLAEDQNVTLDVAGPGILYFARYNHWHGSPWHYVVDGADHLILETSTATPTKPVPDSVFQPSDVFCPPLAFTWSTTKGADVSWVPISFAKSFRMAYSRTHYGTGYYIYHQYVSGTRLSQPIKAWSGQSPPDRDVLGLLNRSGTDIAPSRHNKEMTGSIAELGSDAVNCFAALTDAPATIRKLSFSISLDQAIALGRAHLRLTWDGRSQPSVNAPVALFFGAGTLYNRDQREYLVKAFPCYIRFGKERVELACFFPMPFFKSARLELVAPADQRLTDVVWSVRYERCHDKPSQVGFFHASYRDDPRPVPGQDLVLLDTRETEGGGDWSGSFIGTSFIFSDRAILNTLEGDPRFFFDDSQTPQAYGTGTEEWGGGGDYWGGQNMTLPFAGHPVGARTAAEARNAEDKIESAYRFLLADLMPFGKNALIRLEHGGLNESTQHYQTVTYWYGAPWATLVKTDELKISDAASEAAHRYISPESSAPYSITSRYEWGVDTLSGGNGTQSNVVVYPAHTDWGRKTTGSSEFTLKLNPKNLGVLLRRKLDYSFPNQRAEVFVAPDKALAGSPREIMDYSAVAESRDARISRGKDAVAPGKARVIAERDWKPAGVWYLAGANTCVYSNPKEELGASEHHVQTSNRRFRDDEFLLPRDLTEGRSAIRLRVKFTSVQTPLFPGRPLDELAWSEIRYDAYCYVSPN